MRSGSLLSPESRIYQHWTHQFFTRTVITEQNNLKLVSFITLLLP